MPKPGFKRVHGIPVGEAERNTLRILQGKQMTMDELTVAVYGIDYTLFKRQALGKSVVRLVNKGLVQRIYRERDDRLNPVTFFSLTNFAEEVVIPELESE